MNKKLTAISIYFNGRKHFAFVMLDSPVVTECMLAEIFPEFRKVTRGDTYSIG